MIQFVNTKYACLSVCPSAHDSALLRLVKHAISLCGTPFCYFKALSIIKKKGGGPAKLGSGKNTRLFIKTLNVAW
jgi:hypothetical protein